MDGTKKRVSEITVSSDSVKSYKGCVATLLFLTIVKAYISKLHRISLFFVLKKHKTGVIVCDLNQIKLFL